MNPLVVLDANKVIPDPFALVMVAAARARALRRGAKPRVDAEAKPGPDLALSEIAASVFANEELAPFLPNGPTQVPRLTGSDNRPKLCNGGQEAVVVPVLAERTVH